MTEIKSNPSNVAEHIAASAQRYGDIALFAAFRDDLIPVERFPEFFREQYMAARWFQDLIWALTDIPDGPLAPFAANHRKKDSGHYRWMKTDMERFGLPPMTDDDWFSFDTRNSRIQLARILSRTHQASPEERMVMLGCLEAAGEVTLGTLNAYVHRHGLADKTAYLGDQHVAVEERQSAEIANAIAEVMASDAPALFALVDLVFDALTNMFEHGGERYYASLIHGAAA